MHTLECHSGRILFRASTVLEMKKDSCGMTYSFVLLKTTGKPANQLTG
jgi:hypothetical protein